MAEAQESHGRWWLRYVIVPIAVVVVGAGAKYYFDHWKDGPGYDPGLSETGAMADDGGSRMAVEPTADPSTGRTTVPPPPRRESAKPYRQADGTVVVPPPSSQ